MFDLDFVQTKFSKLIGAKLKTFESLAPNGEKFELFFDNGYILSVNCFIRLTLVNKIILTSCDEIFSLGDNDIRKQKNTLSLAKELLLNRKIVSVTVSKTGDILICFENKCCLLLFPDCQFIGYEFYKLHNSNENVCIVVKIVRGKLFCVENDLEGGGNETV